jgi:hypothetical protein
VKLTSLGNVNENESCVVINQNKSQARQVDTTARTDMFDLDQCYYINTPLTRILKCSNISKYERERKGLGLGFIFFLGWTDLFWQFTQFVIFIKT